MRKIIEGQIYRHFKGHMYKVLCIGKDSETLKEVVIYRNIDTNEVWVRPLDMFSSLVDKNKYPDIKQKYRFELVDDIQRI